MSTSMCGCLKVKADCPCHSTRMLLLQLRALGPAGPSCVRTGGCGEGWLAEALEQSFSAEERETLDEAVRLMSRLSEL